MTSENEHGNNGVKSGNVYIMMKEKSFMNNPLCWLIFSHYYETIIFYLLSASRFGYVQPHLAAQGFTYSNLYIRGYIFISHTIDIILYVIWKSMYK